ncbi:MAG: hypothetical protein AAGF74_05400 [Pseudomonadota bacterium]
MATKAELEAELAALKLEMNAPANDPAEADPEPKSGDTRLEAFFADHGLSKDDLEALWSQFSKELGDLPHEKPITLALGAFGLGFLLGRMSK